MGVRSLPPGKEAFIALGGNLGDVRQSFEGARDMLAADTGIELLASSLLYASPPMGPQNQPDYLNAVLLVITSHAPLELLHRMQSIELHFGRRRDGQRWGERTLDLDLIAYNDTQMQLPELTLPHPGMKERMFVLQPICDIRPAWRHPATGETATLLMEQLLAHGEKPLAPGIRW